MDHGNICDCLCQKVCDCEDSETQLPPPCRAKGLPICEPEVVPEPEEKRIYVKPVPPEPAKTLLCDCVQTQEDIADGEEEKEDEELSYKEPPTIDNELQLEDIRDVLEKSKRRVELIDKLLMLNTPECPPIDPCVDIKVEINKHSVPPSVLQLQRNNHQLRQQVKQLQQCCTAADVTVRSVRNSLCRDLEAAQRLQLRLNQMNSFKLELQHQQTLCAQRYRHLMNDKYDWDDCYSFISKLENYPAGSSKLVTRSEYNIQKLEVLARLDETREYVRQLYDIVSMTGPSLMYRPSAASVTSRVSRQSRISGRYTTYKTGCERLAGSIRAFMKRNEHLFNWK